MRPNEADKKELERLSQEARARSIVSRQDAAKERVAAIVAECATQEEIDAEYDKLTEQIKEGRPAAEGSSGDGSAAWSASAIAPFVYSRSCTRRRSSWCFVTVWLHPAKKNDVVAIPKDYIAWGVAVVDLMDERYPGRRDPRAFCGIRALQHKNTTVPEVRRQWWWL